MSTPSSKKYACKTQDGHTSTVGVAPASHLNTQHSNDETIVLGIGSIIPRWDVIKQPNRELQYFVRADTFLSDDDAQFATSSLQAAADQWNALNLGLSIIGTDDAASANFNVLYFDPDNPKDRTLARAFFPNEIDQDVLVYKFAFDDDKNREILTNIFTHELGHVLGLRHEFAITGDAQKHLGPEGEGAVQFLGKNPKSVMSYEFPPTMQDSDREGTKKFYKLKNGGLVGGEPVTDYLPTLRQRA